MMWPALQTVSEIVISRVLNSLPEGILIALFSGMILRLLPRQNSRTRFAVWFVALLAVAALPVAGLPLFGRVAGHSFLASSERPLITLGGPWGLMLFLVWILVASVALLRLAVGLWQLRGLRRSCVAIDEAELDSEKRNIVAEFRSSRSVTLATSEKVNVPTAVGFFKPMIVIPVWALRELTASELKVVLLHEFAHLRRGDSWSNLLQKIVRAVFLFHPAVWWIERRLSLEREMACDDQVLAEMANPHGYAKCLVALLEKSVARRSLAMAQAAVHRAHEASLRLAQILEVARPNSRSVWKPALGLVSAFSLICLVVVPRAPQLVSFEQEQPVLRADTRHSVIFNQSRIPTAVVIPASLHTPPSLPLRKTHQANAARPVNQLIERSPERSLESQAAAPQVIDARFNADSKVTNRSDAMQTSEAVLIIQTAQRVGPNSWVWSVDVWRVNLVDATQHEARKAPLAKKT
ncbi:MAG: M56 family metallopeptidase [Candidatus Sulfotelmatobacter sp.]